MACRPAALLCLLLPLAAACRPSPPKVTSCADQLAGVWSAAGGDPARRYVIIDDGRRPVEIFPMWDTTRPPSGRKPQLVADPAAGDPGATVVSPFWITLTRAGAGLEGTTSYRLSRGERTCEVRQPARIPRCADGVVVLALEGAADVDLGTCAIRSAAPATEVALRREW